MEFCFIGLLRLTSHVALFKESPSFDFCVSIERAKTQNTLTNGWAFLCPRGNTRWLGEDQNLSRLWAIV